MAVPTNNLVQVQTYQKASLAPLLNQFVFIETSNKKFKNFENLTANLGDTVTFDLTPRYITVDGLIAQTQPSTQRVQTLTVDKSKNVAFDFTSQQFIFNVKDYMDRFGMGAVLELGSVIEADMAQTILDNTYRFYGYGINPIDSAGELAKASAYFYDYGASSISPRGYLDTVAVASIVNSMLNQFTPKRNDEIQSKWMMGDFAQFDWYKSNMLATQIAGTIGNSNKTSSPVILTVISTNDVTGANITQLTCSTSPSVVSDPSAIKKNDLLYFLDGVSGQPDLRYLKFIGHTLSQNKVQIRATADAATDGSGNIVINISPSLNSTISATQNVLYNIVAGMKLSVIPSHRAGALISGDALYLAMPQLPDQDPFLTAYQMDKESGASLRLTKGSILGQNQNLMIYDSIWGKTLVAENAMRLIFPL